MEKARHRRIARQISKLLLGQWRIALFAIVVVLATLAFMSVSTTEQQEPSTLPEAFYHSLTLFVLETDGFPDQGHPFWLGVAWAMYFLAPFIALSAFIEVVHKIRRAMASPDRATRGMRDHFIVCGYGNHGRMILDTLLTRYPDEQAVIIDNDPALEEFVVVKTDRRVPVIRADLQHDPVNALSRAQLRYAKELVLATGDDVLNLSLCAAAQGQDTILGFRCIALVSDLDLAAGFEGLIGKETHATELISTYKIAADALLDRIARDREPFDPSQCGLLVLGFGRFGSTLTKAAQQRWPDLNQKPWLTIVDLNAEAKLLAQERRDDTLRGFVRAINGNIEDPSIIDKALSESTGSENGHSPMIVLCTDSDTTNLRTAMIVRKYTGSRPVVLTRMFERPPHHLEELLTQHQIQCFELRDLIAERLEL